MSIWDSEDPVEVSVEVRTDGSPHWMGSALNPPNWVQSPLQYATSVILDCRNPVTGIRLTQAGTGEQVVFGEGFPDQASVDDLMLDLI